jgi:hypothetical protein
VRSGVESTESSVPLKVRSWEIAMPVDAVIIVNQNGTARETLTHVHMA